MLQGLCHNMITPVPSINAHGRVAPAQAFQAAMTLQRLGRSVEAERLYHYILAGEPDHFGSLCGLGAIRRQQGKLDEAVLLFCRAAGAAASSADAQACLGNIFVALNRPAEAIGCYQRALAIKPDLTGAHCNLGNVLRMVGRAEEAIVHYRQALAIAPDSAEVHCHLGNALMTLGRRDEAMAHYEKASPLRPDIADAHDSLGSALQILDRLVPAGRSFESAPPFASDRTHLYPGATDAQPIDAGLPRVVVSRQGCARTKIPLGLDEPMSWHFALDRAYADLKQLEQSLLHLLKSNALRRPQVTYH
jgi:tetratricopeptide (TPR) repeat protein